MSATVDLSKKSMLVGLKISQWGARKFDRGASREVWTTHNATAESGRFSKSLMPLAAERLAITRNANEARAFYYANTLPWGDDGLRILPTENYMDFAAKMAKFKNTHERLVSTFCGKYPALKEAARFALGTLFSEADYPHESRIRESYAFEVVVRPMVVSNDFRCALADDEVERIKAAIEEEVNGAVRLAVRDVWERLHEAVKKMADKLAEPDAIFRDTLVGNIQELVDVLPRLNLTKDPALDNVLSEVRDKLAKRDPDTLRKDVEERKDTAKEAAALLEKIAGYGGLQ